MAPIGCAKRALGTMLAMTKPIDRTLQVLMSSAMVNENHGTCAPGGKYALSEKNNASHLISCWKYTLMPGQRRNSSEVALNGLMLWLR